MSFERRGQVTALDVLDRVLDKGIVIDYWARVSVLGVDLLTTIDARIVVSCIDTYLCYAEPIAQSRLLARRMV